MPGISWKTIWQNLNKWFIGPLFTAAIGTLLIARIIAIFIGPAYYSVYVVGPFSQAGMSDVLDKFNRKENSWSIDGVYVNMQVQDDQGDPAAAQRIAADLAGRKDTLLIIGHFQSTSSKQALPLYLDAKPPIPVIMTTETTTNILPAPPNPATHYPVFRLSPTDDVQARAAFNFARKHGAKTFWVVKDDLANTTYSSYLADKFMELAQTRDTSVELETSPTLVLPSSTLNQLSNDWIFFAGSWRSALLFIRQMHASKFKLANILLSDGCATQDLLDASIEGKELENVYVTYPLDAKTFNENHYSAYADDSLALLAKVIDEANSDFYNGAAEYGGLAYRIRSLAGIHRIGDARNAVIHAIHSLREEKMHLPHGDASFNRDGVRLRAKFYVWRIQNNKFVDAS